MPYYKLVYFPSPGRGELTRLVFAAAQKPYEDFRLPRADWPEHKQKVAPFAKLPYLEIDGKKYGQSQAIATYLAEEFGLFGNSSLQRLDINQVLHLIKDLQQFALVIFYEKDEELKAKATQSFQDFQQPQFLGYFERFLKENGTRFIVGNKLSLADIAVFDVITGWIGSYLRPLSGDFPLVEGLVDRVGANEGIKKYVAARPKA